jgi:hypothetical protein
VDVDLVKLRKVMDEDNRALEVFRENFEIHVREFAGSNYAEATDEFDNPVNLLALYVRIMIDALVPNDPRMMVSTFDKDLRQFINPMQEAGNRKLLKMDFADLMRRISMNGLFLMGCVHTSLKAPAAARFSGYSEAGEISMCSLDLEDMVFDTRAKKFSECDYICHYYDVFYEDVKNSKMFDSKARKEIVKTDERRLNDGGSDRLNQIAMGGTPVHEQYEEKIRIGECWLRRQNKVITFDAEGYYERPLLVQEFVGPQCGPYKFFSLGDVPGNLIPKGPILDALNMHRSHNLLWTKLDNQASRQKTITYYRDAGTMKRTQDAADGHTVQTEDPSGIVAQSLDGPNPNVANWAMQTYNMFTEYMGNLKVVGGLGSQAKTATQEKLVHESASEMIQAMQMRVMSFAQELMGMDGLAWYLWNSPTEQFDYLYQPAAGIEVPAPVMPRDRIGVVPDGIDIMVDPYSFVRQTPQMRIMGLEKLMKEVIIPLLPMFGQPGIGDVLVEYVKMISKYTNNPDMMILLEKIQGVGSPPEGSAPNSSQPAPETTIHERVSRPGMTDEGQTQVLQQLMAGGESKNGQGAMGLGQMSNGRY